MLLILIYPAHSLTLGLIDILAEMEDYLEIYGITMEESLPVYNGLCQTLKTAHGK